MRRSSSLSREGGMEKPGQRLSAIPRLRRSSSQPPASLGIRSSLTHPSKSPHHQAKSPHPGSHFPLPHYLASATPSERGSSAGMIRNSLTRFSLTDKRGTKDSRNLLDKNYQIQELKKLSAFLKRKNAPFAGPSRVPGSTFKKDFFENFEFMANIISPFYSLSPNCPEEDVLLFLKYFGYPHNFTKSSILSSSSNHSCARLLGILFWMRDVAEYLENFNVNYLMVKDDDFGESLGMKILQRTTSSYDHLIRTGVDQVDEDEKFFRLLGKDKYGTNETLELKIKMLEELFDKKLHLEEEIANFKEIKRKVEMIENDCQKFENFLPELERNVAAYEREVQESVNLYQKKRMENEKISKELIEVENRVMQQRVKFSMEAFKQDKNNLEAEYKELKRQNNILDADNAEQEMVNSKKKFELSNECTKANKLLLNIVETLKLLDKDSLQTFPSLPILKCHLHLKEQPDFKKEQFEPWIKTTKSILKNRLQTLNEEIYNLIAQVKELELKKNSLFEDLVNMEKSWANQEANFKLEEKRLDEELQSVKLEKDLLTEENNKLALDTFPPSNLKNEYRKLEKRLRATKNNNDELQKSYESQMEHLTQVFNQSMEALESKRTATQQKIERGMKSLREKYSLK